MNIWDKFLDAVKVNEEYDDDDFLDDVDDDFEDEKPKKRFFKKLDDDFDEEFDDLPPAKSYKNAEKQSAAAKAPKASRTTTSSSAASSKASAGKVTPMYNVSKKKTGASGAGQQSGSAEGGSHLWRRCRIHRWRSLRTSCKGKKFFHGGHGGGNSLCP